MNRVMCRHRTPAPSVRPSLQYGEAVPRPGKMQRQVEGHSARSRRITFHYTAIKDLLTAAALELQAGLTRSRFCAF